MRTLCLVATIAFLAGLVAGGGLVCVGSKPREPGPLSAPFAAPASLEAPAAEAWATREGGVPWAQLIKTALPQTRREQSADGEYASSRGGDGGRRDGDGRAAWETAGSAVIAGLIAGMSDFELVDTVTGTSLFSAEELDEISDLRGFAERLATIALSGVVTPPADFPAQAEHVEFSRTVGVDNTPGLASEVFYSDAGRIYAVFPTDRYDRDTVLVKWQRMDRPQLLVFDRYDISAEDTYSYVWLNQPGGWSEGSYEVTMYAADESLEPIAAGAYDVADEGIQDSE